MSSKNRQDWGCLHWFILGFAIFAMAIFLLVMLVTPSSDGDDNSCQSMNVQVPVIVRGHPLRGALRSSQGNDQPLTNILSVGFSGRSLHPGELRHTVTKPGPGAGPKGPAPAKPNLNKQGPAKPGLGQPKPSKGPQKAPKGPKVSLDLDDCD